jgi:uncharacterized protein (TIGR02421 family)
MNSSATEIKHIEKLSNLIVDASKSIKILTHIGWPQRIKQTFFAQKESKMPEVTYSKFDSSNCYQSLNKAKKLLGDNAIDDWFSSKIDVMETSARLLEHCGTNAFFKYSTELYGAPMSALRDEVTTPLDLALQFRKISANLTGCDLGEPPKACILATTVAKEMRQAMAFLFADAAPKVYVVDDLSANALAGAQSVRIRKSACFTDKDVSQLIHHEAFVHVATSLNGQAQPILKLLAINSPASTKTQEGLAVFAELISGSIDIDRLNRLADRVIAIQMSIDGADFMEIYQFYKERTNNPEQSFENARRVFRGGVLTGGAPFTKDVVYLDGLLRVHDFLKSLVSSGRADCLRLLFCGKLDIEDIPMLGWMMSTGICKPALYLPPWASDLRFLVSYLAYSTFSSEINFQDVHKHHKKMLQDVPKLS